MFCRSSNRGLQIFLHANDEAIQYLNSLFGEAFLIRPKTIKNSKILPGTMRFVETPKTKAEYIYFGDIDLLVFDDILEIHIKLIEKYDIPFSNMLRIKSLKTEFPRLTGLHFCEYNNYYPLPNISDLNLSKLNDEHVLYCIMNRKGLMVSKDFQTRPLCGIHISLNRDPVGRTSGSIYHVYESETSLNWLKDEKYHKRFLEAIKEIEFLKLFRHLDIEIKSIFLTLEASITGKLRTLKRRAVGHIFDKRLLFQKGKLTRKNQLLKRDEFIFKEDYENLIRIGSENIILWPFNIDMWHQQAWAYNTIGNYDMVVECLIHLLELPGGKKLYQKSDLSKKESFLLENISENLKGNFNSKLKSI